MIGSGGGGGDHVGSPGGVSATTTAKGGGFDLALIAVGASIPFATGALSAGWVWAKRLPYRYSRHAATFESIRNFLGLSGYVLVGGVAELVIYSLDSVILATFRSTAAVGLYQGPVRAHNLVLQVQSALVTPVLSVSSRYLSVNQ